MLVTTFTSASNVATDHYDHHDHHHDHHLDDKCGDDEDFMEIDIK